MCNRIVARTETAARKLGSRDREVALRDDHALRRVAEVHRVARRNRDRLGCKAVLGLHETVELSVAARRHGHVANAAFRSGELRVGERHVARRRRDRHVARGARLVRPDRNGEVFGRQVLSSRGFERPRIDGGVREVRVAGGGRNRRVFSRDLRRVPGEVHVLSPVIRRTKKRRHGRQKGPPPCENPR